MPDSDNDLKDESLLSIEVMNAISFRPKPSDADDFDDDDEIEVVVSSSISSSSISLISLLLRGNNDEFAVGKSRIGIDFGSKQS